MTANACVEHIFAKDKQRKCKFKVWGGLLGSVGHGAGTGVFPLRIVLHIFRQASIGIVKPVAQLWCCFIHGALMLIMYTWIVLSEVVGAGLMY